MPPKKSAPAGLIAKAAELRAGGASWDAVAAQVGRAADTVRRWPATYPDLWKKAFRAAERQLIAEATAEAVLTLRRQLRSDDEKASRDAAQKLIQFRVALGKPRRSAAARGRPKADAEPTTDAGRIAAYIETLSDDQIDQLLDRLVPELVQGRGQPRASPEGP